MKAIALLLLTGICLAQTPRATTTTGTAGTIPNSWTGTTGTSSVSTVGSDTTWSTSTANIVWADGSGGQFVRLSGRGSIPAETRKDDGRGPSLEQVRHSARVLTAAQVPPASYRQVAMSIGLKPSPITDEVDIMSAIDAQGLHVYDWGKVDQYLYRQALKQGSNTRWVWKPLRESDKKATDNRGWGTSSDHVGFVYSALYAQAIPLRVLDSIKVMLDRVPDAVFLVSDYEVIRPDPFLAVTTERLLSAGKIWIIDQWDEPGFSEVPEGMLVSKR